jgi:hypothetical protein
VSGGSLVVYQLHHLHEQWSAKISRLLELALFNIALYPYWQDCEYYDFKENTSWRLFSNYEADDVEDDEDDEDSEDSEDSEDIEADDEELLSRHVVQSSLRDYIRLISTKLSMNPIERDLNGEILFAYSVSILDEILTDLLHKVVKTNVEVVRRSKRTCVVRANTKTKPRESRLLQCCKAVLDLFGKIEEESTSVHAQGIRYRINKLPMTMATVSMISDATNQTLHNKYEIALSHSICMVQSHRWHAIEQEQYLKDKINSQSPAYSCFLEVYGCFDFIYHSMLCDTTVELVITKLQGIMPLICQAVSLFRRLVQNAETVRQIWHVWCDEYCHAIYHTLSDMCRRIADSKYESLPWKELYDNEGKVIVTTLLNQAQYLFQDNHHHEMDRQSMNERNLKLELLFKLWNDMVSEINRSPYSFSESPAKIEFMKSVINLQKDWFQKIIQCLETKDSSDVWSAIYAIKWVLNVNRTLFYKTTGDLTFANRIKNYAIKLFTNWNKCRSDQQCSDRLHICLYEVVTLLSKTLCLLEIKLDPHNDLYMFKWWLEALSSIKENALNGADKYDDVSFNETNLVAMHRLATWISLHVECLLVRQSMKHDDDDDDESANENEDEDESSTSSSSQYGEESIMVIEDNAMEWIASRSRKAVAILSRIKQDGNGLLESSGLEKLLEKVSIDPEHTHPSMLWFKQFEVECLLRDDDALQKARSTVEGYKTELQFKLQTEKQNITNKSFPAGYLAELMFINI